LETARLRDELEMEREEKYRLRITIEDMAVTMTKDMVSIHELKAQMRSVLLEKEHFQKEYEKLCASSRADKRRIQRQRKELSSLKKKAKEEGWAEKPAAHPMRLRSSMRKL